MKVFRPTHAIPARSSGGRLGLRVLLDGLVVLVAVGVLAGLVLSDAVLRTDGPAGALVTVGYPAANGSWTWQGWPEDKWQRFKLPKTAADYDAKGQFHILPVSIGRPEEQVQCSDCHTAGFDPANITKGVKESCVVCHNPNPEQLADVSTPVAAGVQCTSCHMQHTTGKDPLALVRARQVNEQKK